MKVYLKIFIVLFAVLLLAACSNTTTQPTEAPVAPQVDPTHQVGSDDEVEKSVD